MNRIRRHLALAVTSLLLAALAYLATPPPSVIHRLCMATAYAGFAFLAASLWLGPWNVLRRKPNPVSFHARRDIGIWAGLLAILHTVIGFSEHLPGRKWMFFFRTLHPLSLQKTQFGVANDTGLVAALLFLMLVLISNDISLRRLGLQRWKFAQRATYAAFVLTVVHGFAYQAVEKRPVTWVLFFAAGILVVMAVQLTGAWYRYTKRGVPASGQAAQPRG